jgi:hypothetical protein
MSWNFAAIPVNQRGMTTIARFQVPEDAYLLRAYLDSQGIRSFVFDEHVVQLFWHYSNAIGGVRVVVDDADLEEAYTACRKYMGALHAEPKLVSVVRGWPVVALLFLVLGAPAVVFARRKIVSQEYAP